MSRIDIVVSNDRHHVGMARPLLAAMLKRGHSCRVLSLCEYRGITTPVIMNGNIPTLKLSRVKRPRSGKVKGGGQKKTLRVAQAIAWRMLLARNVRSALIDRPDLVVLFNDAAHPYDRISSTLSKLGIPFVLVQEGIRYEVAGSAERGSLNQGRGGADAIAVWGESSAEYFRNQGASPLSIYLTGNPRFDVIGGEQEAKKALEIKERLGLNGNTLLFLSNPVEFHGYCTIEQKLDLVREFILKLDPLFRDPSFRLVFKLHSHENVEDFLSAAEASRHLSQIVIADNCELWPLFHIVNGAVIFSTTAGLEAMLYGIPLGVLELPGVGFLHDYVSEGAALPLRWSEPMSVQIESLLALKDMPKPGVEKYLERTLAVRDGATEKVLDLLENILRS